MSSRRVTHNRSPAASSRAVRPAATSAADDAAVHRLIADGDTKGAVELAKEYHQIHRTAASETVLVDAYVARIGALRQRQLEQEAEALIALVRRRYPAAKHRLDALGPPDAAGCVSLDDLVRPLADPAVASTRRAEVERAVRSDVWDLAALAGCDALASTHPLRIAAAALDRALTAVTSGPVSDDGVLALPEVSHRSPLAPWKPLVRAIASFHRGDDAACARSLDAIDPESAPARLVPALRALIPSDARVKVTPAAAALRTQIIGATAALRRALEDLDRAFASGKSGPILKAIRASVQECQQTAPSQLDALRQHISVRCAVADLDVEKVRAAMGGPSRHDAAFFRLYARALEETRNPELLLMACQVWESFRQAAADEGWFPVNGAEAAALALRIADMVQQVPEELLRQLQWKARAQAKPGAAARPFLFPDEMYARACALDPHAEAFSRWMTWAARQPGGHAERIAAAWHKAQPAELEPLLRLISAAESRRSFRLALAYLAKAERIDGLDAGLRRTRLRVLAQSALHALQRKKVDQAADAVTAMVALPLAQQADYPALVAALRCVTSLVSVREDAAARREEVVRVLDSRPAATLLLDALARAAKHPPSDRVPPLGKQSPAERASLPAVVARVAALTADIQVPLNLPRTWITAVVRQFPACGQTLDVEQLRALGEAALRAEHVDLAYAVSVAGLGHGGRSDAQFLFLRAGAVRRQFERHAVCATAAAELARHQRDQELVAAIVDVLREAVELAGFTLTLDQARDVLAREKAATTAPTRREAGPDYQDLLGGPCQCARCRRRRGESGGQPFDALDPGRDEDDDEADLDLLPDLPPGLPPEVAELFMSEARDAAARGESFAEFMARLRGGSRGRRPRQKKKRR